MKFKKLKAMGIGLMMMLAGFPSVFAVDYLPVQAYSTDTVAGYPSALRTSIIDQYQDVSFRVEKPDGAIVNVPAQADAEGIAKTDLYGHQTKIAGEYMVSVVYPGQDLSSPSSNFTVYPDQVSPTQSIVSATLQMLEAGGDVTFLVVTLYDQYRNPISDHQINLISSRGSDSIEALQSGVTDHNGRATFRVFSAYPGISVYSAMDVTVNQVLQDREEVVFSTPIAPAIARSPFAELLRADIGQGVIPGPVDHFEISGIPSTVKVGDELSLTVTAKDKNDNAAKNYTGTILFSVPDDENAVLPSNGEYTFKDSDQGAFTFDLSLQFSGLGNQVIQVFDKNNFQISGEHSVEVVPKSAVFTPPTSSDLVIKSPIDGAELGSNLVIITGQGFENINLKVFDNDAKIGDTETDEDGFFSFEAKNLDSGPHNFYVMSEANEVSKSVSLSIDTIPPVLNSFEIYPEGAVLPGDTLSISVQSEPDIEEAKVRIQGVEEVLSETSPGTYEATVIAPVQDGVFPVDVILIDGLANKGEFLNKGTISVQSPTVVNPPTVEGFEGQPDDASIVLTWQPVSGHERTIQKYRVYYGTVMDQLEQSVDTVDSTPQWQLRGLENDTQYFVAIKAIDNQGLESDEFSVTIAVTPILPDPCADVSCGDYGQCSEGACVCDAGWTGLTCNIEPEPIDPFAGISQVSATPFDSAVMLSWPPFPGVQAYYYKVFMGFSPGQYNDSVITTDNRTTLTVSDLVNSFPYYFAVAALDINGIQVSALSQEVQSTPNGVGFRPSAPSPVPFDASYQVPATSGVFDQNIYRDQLGRVPGTDPTGPEAVWIMLGSLVFAHFLYHHKKKVLQR